MAAPADSRFSPLPNRQAAAERITTPPISFLADAWRRFKANPMALLGLIILLLFLVACFAGPLFAVHDSTTQSLTLRDKPPSADHWFGTDALGRDLFVRTLYGGRISLAVAFFAGLVQLFIGVIYGATSGLLGGKWDNFMMRVVDTVDSIPMTIYVILLAVILEPGLTSIFVAIGIVYWTSMARLVRAQVLALKEQEFMLAARALGASRMRLVIRHLIPNALAPIIVELTFSIPRAIFTESFLAFIGLGVSAPTASWGVLASDGFKGLRSYPWELVFPAAAIIIISLSFNFIGDGLRDALDPKQRR